MIKYAHIIKYLLPHEIDELDVSILNSLIEDGRKSFRQISRELKISTPTIKSRYERLVNIGLIKSISPVIDTSILQKKSKKKIKQSEIDKNGKKVNIVNNMHVNIECDYCDGPVASKPHVLKFSKLERFFCCSSCKALYQEKYKGRISSLIKKN